MLVNEHGYIVATLDDNDVICGIYRGRQPIKTHMVRASNIRSMGEEEAQFYHLGEHLQPEFLQQIRPRQNDQ